MRNVSLLMTTLLLAAGCGVDALDPAAGSTDDVATERAARAAPGRAPERHCLVNLEPGAPGGPAKAGAMTCYGSISEVILAATDGRVALPAATRASEVNEDLLASAGYDPTAASLASVLIGIDYSEPYYGGASLTWTAPYGCYDPYSGSNFSWFTNGMPFGWDNVVSSAQTFSYCRSTTFYDYPYQSGSSASYGCDAPTLPWLDNAASSQGWFPFGYCPWF